MGREMIEIERGVHIIVGISYLEALKEISRNRE